MRLRLAKRALIAVLATAAAAGAVVVTASPALANTLCVAGQNAGYSNGGSGNNYWGWCHPNGGSVNFSLDIRCWGDDLRHTSWGSGSGFGAVYTSAITCGSAGVEDFFVYNR
jgi:hypothetical protein